MFEDAPHVQQAVHDTAESRLQETPNRPGEFPQIEPSLGYRRPRFNFLHKFTTNFEQCIKERVLPHDQLNRGTTKHVLTKDGTANYDDVAKALDRAKVCMLGILGIARVVVIGDHADIQSDGVECPIGFPRPGTTTQPDFGFRRLSSPIPASQAYNIRLTGFGSW